MTYPLKNDYVATDDPYNQARADEVANLVNSMYLGFFQLLTPTATKTATYTAVANDYVIADATAGGFVVNLPSAPPDQTIIGVGKIDSTANVVTVTRAGTDRFFYATSGPTTVGLVMQGEFRFFIYQANGANGVWLGLSEYIQLGSLDARYILSGNNASIITVKDANFTLQDDGDVTKQARFQLSGITPGATRTFTFPNATTGIVGTDVQQTLLLKTLTSPKISSGNAPATAGATGIAGQIEWDSGFVYVCVATDTWKRVAIATW